MKKLFLLAGLLSLSLLTFAQESETVPTARNAWCRIVSVEEPNVKDFKEAGELLLDAFPTAKECAEKMPIMRKIYMNNMRGVLMQTEKWDKLTPEKRRDLSRQGVDFTLKFLEWKKGVPNKEPAGFMRTELKDKDPCLEAQYDYGSKDDCYSHAKYLFIESYEAARQVSVIREFWAVMKYLSAVAECDEDKPE